MSIILCVIVCKSSISQSGFDYRFWRDSLQYLRNEVMYAPNETDRMALNEEFMSLLEEVLLQKNSFQYQWDSVRNFSVVASPDGEFKLFTWYIMKDDYSCENFGFIQKKNSNRMKNVLFPLYDKRRTIDYPQSHIGDINRWYGAVYYKIIPLQFNKEKTYYTLLGWNGNDRFTNQKVIEVLSFKNNTEQTPVFGAYIFKKYSQSRVARVILEYAKEASLSLKFERQSYTYNTGKRDKKTRKPIYETVAANMIIFNQLFPAEEATAAITAFLLPESSMNQGFIVSEGRWLYIPKVNGHNSDAKTYTGASRPKEFHAPNRNTNHYNNDK
ncbi:MAG: hypothetical protein LBL18_00245 [Bacteroidales bacterium]|nr:hypothetical protein [Bacteroidales bacterium]